METQTILVNPPSSPDQPQPATAESATGFRWVIIGLAFFITLVNYLDRSAISWSIDPLCQEFHLSKEDFGYIASAFGIGYMVMTVGGGILVDKLGSRKVWSTACIFWSTCMAATSLAAGYWPLFMLRTGLGLAEGPHFPALSRVVADWLPSSERARATAFGLVGVPLASTIGAPLLSHMVVSYGWKATFVALGSLGIAWAVCWFALYRDYPENSKFVSDSELKHIREGRQFDRTQTESALRSHDLTTGTTSWRFMLLNPSLMANNFAFFSFGYLIFFAMTWFPGYLEHTYHLALKQVGYFLVAPWLTAAVLVACAGWLSDFLYTKTGSMRVARSHMIWSCQLASALCFVPVVFTPSLNLAIVCISLGVGLGMMPNAAFYALNCDIARDRAGTSIGIMDCFFAAAGIAAPALTGIVAQVTGGFAAAFGLLIAFTILSVVAVLLLQKPDPLQDKTVVAGATVPAATPDMP
jgi:sugar phosphate permease